MRREGVNRVPRDEKARILAHAAVTSNRAAAKASGVNEASIRYWRKDPEFAHLLEASRDALAEDFWVAIQIGVEEVAKGLRGDAPLRDKAIALGVLYDKHALLTGAATSRTESRDLTGTLPDEDLIAAVREAERITGEGGAPPAA